MNAPFTIILYAADSLQAAGIAGQCFKQVDSLVAIFSDYIDSSELNRLCAGAGKKDNLFICSLPLFDILQLSKSAFEKTAGSFDISVGPLTRLWRKARKENNFPDDSLVKKKLLLTGFDKITIDKLTHAVHLAQAGMQLDLGGIAQGYIAQKTIDYIQRRKIEHALVDVSGDIVTIGAPPGTKGWTVAINVPESDDALLPNNLVISNKAVTTSGDVYQYISHMGKRYSHIIDPATGYGITSQKNVTVIAGDGTTADWLTKACSILPVDSAKKLATSLHAEVLIAQMVNDKVVFFMTKGFRHYWARAAKRQKRSVVAQSSLSKPGLKSPTMRNN